MKPTPPDFARAFLRSFAVQASWNYRSFIAGGLAFCLLPMLRRIHGGDPEAKRRSIARALEPFNAHPYLSLMAAGALARMEHQGTEDAALPRLRRAMQGPLGAVGDRLVWAGWRPFCLLSTVIAYSLGVGPRASVLIFLVTYNVGHLALRAWAFHRGWHDGSAALEGLSTGWPGETATLLSRGSVVLVGGAAVLVSLGIGGGDGLLVGTVATAATAAGFRWPEVAGRVAVPLVAVALLLARVGGAV